MEYSFWGWESADCPALTEEYKGIKKPSDLYDALTHVWCADTCAPRLRMGWSRENMTLGQCSITAFLAQDIFGGKVYGILRPGGNYHCYNTAGGCSFDLTSEQFGPEILHYENNPEQFREIHFAKEEKRLRYEYLKEQLKKYCDENYNPSTADFSGTASKKQPDKIAVLFPGIGYNCSRPLLYYAGKLAQSAGHELVPVNYSGFPSGVKGNRSKMEASFHMALDQTEKILADINWKEYTDIIFISKSIGTVVGAAYAKKYGLRARHIFYTPLADTFLFDQEAAVAFHGTSDPWASDPEIIQACHKAGIPLYLTENANHSLETGDVIEDIKELKKVMKISRKFITKDKAE